jgi:putative ABC transport system permease protein
VYRVAMPGYFRTIGMRLVRGRDFDERDREGAPRVAVINQTMARRLWPGEDAMGKRIRLNTIGGPGEWAAVVGILRDARQWDWSDAELNEMYFPFAQDPMYQHNRGSHVSMILVMRTAGEPSGMAAAVRAQLRELDAGVPVTAMRDMEQVIRGAVWQPRMEMSVLAGFAGLALLLALVGIYAVMTYVVSGRTQEIGIRMALGAGRRQVVGMVLGQSLGPVAVGVAAGMAGAALLTQSMARMLYGVKPADPAVLGAAAAALALVAAGAAAIPAARAAKVDPLAALREE